MPCPQGVDIPGIMYLPVLWNVRHAVESAQMIAEHLVFYARVAAEYGRTAT